MVLKSSVYCSLGLDIKALSSSLRMLRVGIAPSHASTAQRRRSGAYLLNLLLSDPQHQGEEMLFAHLLRKLHEAAHSPRGLDTACNGTGCIEQ